MPEAYDVPHYNRVLGTNDVGSAIDRLVHLIQSGALKGPKGDPGKDSSVPVDQITQLFDTMSTRVRGLDGAEGPQGEAGPQGETGPEGPQGETGPEGPQGPPGPQGATGPQGPKGDVGPQGPPGLRGEDGRPGRDGEDGKDGKRGPAGPPGETIVMGSGAPQDALGTVGFVLEGNGSPVAVGLEGDLGPWNTPIYIESAALLADQAGDIQVDLWAETVDNFPPTAGNSITGGNPLTLTSAASWYGTGLLNWTRAIPRGTSLRVKVLSASTVERVTVTLNYRRV